MKRTTENVTSMTRASFWNFVLKLFILELALYPYCGDKKQNTTSFKSLVSKSARTWLLKRPEGINRLL